MGVPLADRLRPQQIEDVVGQTHLLGKGKVLYQILQNKQIPNMIFYGPSGVGKTTVARMVAKQAKQKLVMLNGTTASLQDIKEVIAQLDTFSAANGIVLYLDEIQYFNKRQQQSLLNYLENGAITLIASTTENPYFSIYHAVLSRCTVFEFKAVAPEEIEKVVHRAFAFLEQELCVTLRREAGVEAKIALTCGGDVRKSINAAELCALGAPLAEGTSDQKEITLALVDQLAQRSSMHYDRDQDQHYDLLSALQKSIRGSDENAAIHYLARLLEAGDLLSPCRRLLVIASEDIGLAYPQAVAIVKACVDNALQLGLPEARIPLAEAVILLATAPKSNSAYMAINRAMADVKAGKAVSFPRALQNKHFDGAEQETPGQHYLYPHDYPHHYVAQQYMPDELVGTVYYEYGDNKTEQAAKQYWSGKKQTS